jgi:hypothetical protein
MRYIVEVAIDAGNLARKLSQMRAWLDHMKFQAVGFRQIRGANIYRVDFEGEQEARAFAQAFGGQVPNRTLRNEGLELLPRAGEPCTVSNAVDNMIRGSDYPHSESTFPQSRKILAVVPDDEQAKPARDHGPGITGVYS